MKDYFNLGDLLLLLDTELFYCSEIRHDTHLMGSGKYIFIMLNPKHPHRLRKRIFYGDEPPKILNSPHWKYYPIIE